MHSEDWGWLLQDTLSSFSLDLLAGYGRGEGRGSDDATMLWGHSQFLTNKNDSIFLIINI